MKSKSLKCRWNLHSQWWTQVAADGGPINYMDLYIGNLNKKHEFWTVQWRSKSTSSQHWHWESTVWAFVRWNSNLLYMSKKLWTVTYELWWPRKCCWIDYLLTREREPSPLFFLMQMSTHVGPVPTAMSKHVGPLLTKMSAYAGPVTATNVYICL